MRSFCSGMLRVGVSCLLTATVLSVPALPAQAATAAKPAVTDRAYILRFGDSINIQMVGNDRLHLQGQAIRPDGRVSVPLVGEIQAAGLTVPQLTERLTKSYARFFVEPSVVVTVAAFRPLKIQMLGMVRNPGIYAVAEPVRLLEGLALAGGLDTERANLAGVVILKPNGTRRDVNLEAVLEGRERDDVLLEDGDTVKVAEGFKPDWYRLLPTLAAALSIIGTVVVLYSRYEEF